MRFAALGTLVVVLLACGCQSGTPLFNGRDLSGWQEIGSTGAWTVQDGVVACSGQKDEYAWLCSPERYGDFELTLDWRLGKEGNSGIFLRVPDPKGRTSMKGFEVQIRDDSLDDNLDDTSGAVFRRIPASGKYSKPVGQWNHYRLTVVGRRLRIELNGHLVSDTDIDTVKPLDDDRPMSRVPNEGFIGLQNHGTPVEFRNVRLRAIRGTSELDTCNRDALQR